ncbi:hypothetical protein [Sulfitobacter sp. R18_1]|uniref:hypothetical protein n=1 Tax=Sulfitobacter sp. R18_1 TaxID=2821104 RepID=UPI001ADB7E78|nr:hypothetical protein [Sulfitobacter sp. R18_1]MBO9428581.1 hypothetical protein [Sulfitobacter sp. R18_1]
MRYLTFIEDKTYTSDKGEDCTLDQHLDDLRKWGGTPDCFESHDNLNAAKSSARDEPYDLMIVDTLNEHRPVYRHRAEPEPQAPSPM